MEEKLGWLREYASDVERWDACQRVISPALTFVNEQGLSCGAARAARIPSVLARKQKIPGAWGAEPTSLNDRLGSPVISPSRQVRNIRMRNKCGLRTRPDPLDRPRP